MLKFSLLVPLLALTVSCTNFPHQFNGVFVVLDDKKTAGEMHVNDVHPVFSFESGAIYWKQDSSATYRLPRTGTATLSFSLRDAKKIADQVASPQTSQSFAYGLRVTPSDTRISRVGTVAIDSVHDSTLIADMTVFGKKDLVILIYVDRPSRLSGDVQISGEIFPHDINLDRAGFHWIVLDADGYVRETDDVGEVEFVAHH
jgi:hypothetical protein